VHELGVTGQERLCSSRVVIAQPADPAASETASDYLARAGLSVAHAAQAEGATEVLVPSTEDLALGAHGAQEADPALRACASYFAGAWAAVEAIKQCAEVGKPSPLGDSSQELVASAILGAEVS